MALEKFRAPPIPNTPEQYNPQQIRQMFRIIELYFNQLDSITPNIASSYRADNFYGGIFSGQGNGIVMPHIAAVCTVDQIATADNTPTVVNWNSLTSGSGWTLNAPGSATASVPGIYTIRYSLQFINTSNAIEYVTTWLRVNGTDVANSATRFSIAARKSSSPGEEKYLAGYSEATFEVDEGDEVELYWATTNAGDPSVPTDGIYLWHDDAITSPYARPVVPSAIGSITFVSAGV